MMCLKRLPCGVIRDLTTPRYKWRIEDYKKYIIDTHTSPQCKIEYTGKCGLSEYVDYLNVRYHNGVAKALGFDLELGHQMKRIHRDRW